jgi:hypothetical protein
MQNESYYFHNIFNNCDEMPAIGFMLFSLLKNKISGKIFKPLANGKEELQGNQIFQMKDDFYL